MLSVIGSKKGFSAVKTKILNASKKRYMPCYEKTRKNSIYEMGFTTYDEYLKSPEWKRIRGNVLKHNPLCFICNNKATQVHHLDYHTVTLSGRDHFNLVSLCRKCHKSIEFEGRKKINL